jgi:Domain of unknown function (DUF4293)
MVQRVQTLFLLAVLVLSGIMLISPLSNMILLNGEVQKWFSIGIKNINQDNTFVKYTIPHFVLVVIITLISLYTILSYNKRQLQLKLCVYNILLSLLLIGLTAYYYFVIKNRFNWDSNSFSLVIIFPIINIVLTFQAFRAIGRDDQLIKSYDRLR